MALEDIRSERIKKREKLLQVNEDPYPAEVRRTHLIGGVLQKFSALEHSRKKICIVGRVMAKREHGGSTFIDVKDGSGTLQAYLKEDVLKENYRLALEVVDIGDFVEVEGKLFNTKKEEKTLEVVRWRMLAKSLLPLPEKWHGLQDVEERFRKRHLDLLMNEGVRERFELRSKIVSLIRAFLEKNGFLEVETPVLHSIPGGALAKPFVTHHNALDVDFYLRIAPELYLKRLLVGGFERVYEIGKNFRNEGIDAEHNPEFTELECYAAYWGEEQMMDFVENLFLALGKALGKASFSYDGKEIAFKKKLPRIAFKDVLARYALVPDYDKESRDSLAIRARQLGIEVVPQESKGKIADEIYKKICRPYLVQPTFVVNHPVDISPLAKKRPDRPEEVRRFQLLVAGMEVANAFAELNDPLDQRKRFEAQEKERASGEEEAHRIDEAYLEAMEYGMPPAAGLGVGIDRVAMLLTNTKNIREVVLFPTMRHSK